MSKIQIKLTLYKNQYLHQIDNFVDFIGVEMLNGYIWCRRMESKLSFPTLYQSSPDDYPQLIKLMNNFPNTTLEMSEDEFRELFDLDCCDNFVEFID